MSSPAGTHLPQNFGWDDATQMPPRMSLYVSGRMLRNGTASVMGFNIEGRDGFPFKVRAAAESTKGLWLLATDGHVHPVSPRVFLPASLAPGVPAAACRLAG